MTLEVLTSDLLAGARHGFFTRKGGASSGIYAGLNAGFGSADQREAVALNRGRAAEAMGVAPDHLLSPKQIHSSRVTIVGPEGWAERPEADGVVTATRGLAISVLTADCAPILLFDRTAEVIGAAHAGWRGALDGVIEATIAAMVGLGAQRDKIRATVGPTISQANYEVGQEFFDRFRDEGEGYERFFIASGDRYRFDLPGFVLLRLREAGVDADWIGRCTYADPARFYSFRRTTHAGEPDYGRLISAIALS